MILKKKLTFNTERILPPVSTRWRVRRKERAKDPRLRLVNLGSRRTTILPELNRCVFGTLQIHILLLLFFTIYPIAYIDIRWKPTFFWWLFEVCFQLPPDCSFSVVYIDFIIYLLLSLSSMDVYL